MVCCDSMYCRQQILQLTLSVSIWLGGTHLHTTPQTYFDVHKLKLMSCPLFYKFVLGCYKESQQSGSILKGLNDFVPLLNG